MSVEQVAMAMWWFDWHRNVPALRGIARGWQNEIPGAIRAIYRGHARTYLRALGRIK